MRIAVGAEGRQALRAALPPDLYQTFIATCAAPPRSLSVCSKDLDDLFSSDLPVPGWEGRTVVTSPMTLRQVMLTGIEDLVRFGKEFTHYEHGPTGKVTAYFADGSRAVGDILIGADGAGSRVREQSRPSMDVHGCGLAIAYGKADLENVPAAKLHQGLTVVNDRRGISLFTQVMNFPWSRPGELKSHVGGIQAALIDTWPGLRHDDTTDHLMWGLMGPESLIPGAADIADIARDWHPALRTVLSRSDPATVRVRPAVNAGALRPRHPTGVTLLGDACHFQVPDVGIGANATLRAAVELCGRLSEAAAQGSSIAEAVAAYENRLRDSSSVTYRSHMRCLTRAARLRRPLIGSMHRTRLRVADQVPGLRRRVVGGYAWLDGLV
ncbi:FAD-dependent oxidoreductase [Actinomadura sp. 9N407]|uniref:FAD-dependent oxidoreductase n=1 Tax=Actinomadura sp. 9N407 TaxID=3375154 RepID=UPI0037B4162B